MFGEIARISLFGYFLKRIRTALVGTKETPPAPPALPPIDFHSLTRNQKGAIFLLSLPTALNVPICKYLGPSTVMAITVEINRMPDPSQVVRKQVLQDFLDQAGLPAAADQTSAIVQIGQLGERDPELLGRIWLKRYT